METQTLQYRRPVEVDDAFLTRLRAVVLAGVETYQAALAENAGLSQDQLNEARAGESLDRELPYEMRYAGQQITEARDVRYTLRFDDDRSIEDSYDGIADAIGSRISRPNRLSVAVGRYDTFRLDISIGGMSFSSVNGSIKGKRRDVTYMHSMLEELFGSARPVFAFLYSRWAGVVACVLSGMVLQVILAQSLFKITGLPSEQGFPIWLTSVILALPMSLYLSHQFERLFPIVHFAFGREERRRAAALWLIFQCVALMIAPIAIAAYFASTAPAVETGKRVPPRQISH